MPRNNTGSIRRRTQTDAKGKKRTHLYARYKWTDALGQTHERERRADNLTHARELIRHMKAEVEAQSARPPAATTPGQAPPRTFGQLADWYEARYLVAPQYVAGQKVSGLRSWRGARSTLKPLRVYFAAAPLNNISYADLETFQAARYATPVQRRGTQRTVAAVNRELSLLRRIFTVAAREGFVKANPFAAGEGLIAAAAETHRNRIITQEDEARLLAACTRRRAHLRPLLICLLDTGLRFGEAVRLTWHDIDWYANTLIAVSYKGKGRNERRVGLTRRLRDELTALHELRLNDSAVVFGIRNNVKRAWASACAEAGLRGLHLHDLRHVAATRLVRSGLSLAETGRILGHRVAQTTYRYANVDDETITRAVSVLDALNETLDRAGVIDTTTLGEAVH